MIFNSIQITHTSIQCSFCAQVVCLHVPCFLLRNVLHLLDLRMERTGTFMEWNGQYTVQPYELKYQG